MKKKLLLLLVFSMVISTFAGISGKIKGYVKDENGEPLPGANVVLDGTTFGAESDEDGYYYIIGVRAGSYQLKCQYVGFRTATVPITVKADLTVTTDVILYSEDYELDEVTYVVSREAKVDQSKTTASRIIDLEQQKLTATVDVQGALKSQAGIKTDADGELHFRGSRSGEVNFNVDGVSVGDPTEKKSKPAEIDFSNIQSFDIQVGVPNAEYGNALSGSVNIVYKVGDQEKTSGLMRYSTDAFMGDNKFDLQSGYFSLNGPFPFLKMKNKPTYFISTNFKSQNGFSESYKDYTGDSDDYYEFGDYDLTGFGFDLPQKRENSFNYQIKTAWDITDEINITLTYSKDRTHVNEFSWFNKYNPENASVYNKDASNFIFNLKQVLNKDSYYNFIFSYQVYEEENLPLGLDPDDIVFETDTDGRTGFDYNGNGAFDGGNYEGFLDVNQNGFFDREYFIDDNKNGFCDVSELYHDANGNNVWDGDLLYDSNGNNKWDYFDEGKSYSGVTVGATVSVLSKGFLTSRVFVPYVETIVADYIQKDVNGQGFEDYIDTDYNGRYVENTYEDAFSVVNEEPFIDGDSWVDTGEPFVDEYRWYIDESTGEKKVYYARNGVWDDATPPPYNDIITREEWNAVVSQFEESGFNLDELGLEYMPDSEESRIIVYSAAEDYCDLRSSRGSEIQTVPSQNSTYDRGRIGTGFGYSSKFDEYEAYTKEIVGEPLTANNVGLGWQAGHKPENITDHNSMDQYVHYIGTYVEYKAPAKQYFNTTSIAAEGGIEKDDLSTWVDINNNGKFDLGNFKYDEGEGFADYNYNGEWDEQTNFAKPNSMTSTSYKKKDIKVMKFKLDYSNQIDKNNLVKTGFEFTKHDFDYFSANSMYKVYDYDTYGKLPNDDYINRGEDKIGYVFEPMEFSYYIQDKMEFEDLVVNAGVRLDMRIHDQKSLDYYEARQEAEAIGYEEDVNKYDSRISPRFGISHAITDKSKLFFSYGHTYQLPNWTLIYDPDNKSLSSNTPIGNMNLSYEQNVLYELGVVNELGEDYLLDVSGYFKDIYDQLNVKEVNQGVFRRYLWENGDYGKTRGIEIKLDRNLKDNYRWSVAYTLAYAYGKSSSETDNLDNADNIARRETPLDWDERHTLNASVSLVYAENDRLFDVPYLDNWSITLATAYGSGKPFTPSEEYYNGKKLAREIERNSERMPYTENTELSLIKTFAFTNGDVRYGDLKFQFDIFNLFDHINVNEVYANTGDWDDPGESVIDGDYDKEEFYADLTRIDERRHYKFTVSYQW
ncbi:MAG: TonB-dependent receptor [Candidatus Delongbacteria bacterium]|nr:TonB-dependent receptor [Candidatus Delongbacteria bacterium]MBN2836296.1 TonB-dependent receptor [Candidatus Delongbacteria bacterium]